MRGGLRPLLFSLWMLAGAAVCHGQGETFEGRLAPLPVGTVTAPQTLGSGSLSAVLDGRTLTISGTYEGVNSRATMAHVHRAPMGLRGPKVFDLTVSGDTRGTIAGRLALTPDQIADLKRGWFYVQLHTENNPEGHLRGWLLKPKLPARTPRP